MKPKKQIWVHPEFARMLQKQKGDTGKDILDLTEDMAKKEPKKKGGRLGGIFEW